MVKCNNCTREAEVKLSYNKVDLCKNCFCDQFENRVRQANRDFSLIGLNEKIAVGISGGKDSIALLYILHKIVKKVHGTTLIPILVDEGIAAHRYDSIAKARELCERLGLELKIISYKEKYGFTMDEVVKLKRADKENPYQKNCTYCGVFRKTLLNRAAKEAGADKLAIGHNADDIAQTFLMNMLHNEPERMKRFDIINEPTEGFVPRIKPLIYNPESETELYCKFKKLPYYKCGCPWSVESFRMDVKNMLNDLEEKYPGIKFNLLRSYLAMNGELHKLRDFEKLYGLKEINAIENVKLGEKNSIVSKKTKSQKKEKKPIFKCQKCGENSATSICKACGFQQEISKKAKRFGKLEHLPEIPEEEILENFSIANRGRCNA